MALPTLHTRYIMNLPFATWADSWDPSSHVKYGYWAIRFYPSGLVLYLGPEKQEAFRLEDLHQPSYSQTLNKVSNMQYLANDIMYFASPVPKTYEFLDDDDRIVYKINYSDFVYNEQEKLYTVPVSIDKTTGQMPFTHIPTKLLFIDPELWYYIEDKHQMDPDICPIYKDVNGDYRLNDGGYYTSDCTFLMDVGRAFTFQNNNLLHRGYPSLSQDEKAENKSSQKITHSVPHTISIPDDEYIHYQYGMKDKATIVNTHNNINNTLYYEDNKTNFLLKQTNYSETNPYILFSNADPNEAFVDYCDCMLLDHYYLLFIADYRRIYRIPENWEINLCKREATTYAKQLQIESDGVYYDVVAENGKNVYAGAYFNYYQYRQIYIPYASTRINGNPCIGIRSEIGYTYEIDRIGPSAGGLISRSPLCETDVLEKEYNCALLVQNGFGDIKYNEEARGYKWSTTFPRGGAMISTQKIHYKLSFARFPWESRNIEDYFEIKPIETLNKFLSGKVNYTTQTSTYRIEMLTWYNDSQTSLESYLLLRFFTKIKYPGLWKGSTLNTFIKDSNNYTGVFNTITKTTNYGELEDRNPWTNQHAEAGIVFETTLNPTQAYNISYYALIAYPKEN